MSLFDDASLVLIPDGAKDSKLYSVKPTDGSGDFTFSRGSNLAATRVNENGLIEKGRENLLLYSEEFDNADWAKTGGTISADSTTSPDGTSTADTLTGDGSELTIRLLQIVTLSAGRYTASFFIKKNNHAFASILFSGFSSGNKTAFFDLDSEITDNADATITPFANGWYLCTLTTDISGADLTGNIRIYAAGSYTQNGFASTADANGKSIYVWGAQLEVGSVATEYIKSTSTTGKAGVLEDLPRIDYSEGGCPSLLLEPQRTNLIIYSEQFDGSLSQTAIGGTAVVTDNDAISPDGNLTAATLSGATDTNFGGNNGFKIFSASANTLYTCSIYVRSDNTTNFQIAMRDDNSGIFTRETYTVTSEWQRVTVQREKNSSSGTIRLYYGGTTADVEIWGAQAEAGSYLTSYIPTNSAAVTRNADLPTDKNIGVQNVGEEGVLFVHQKALVNGGDTRRITLSDGTTDNRVVFELDESANKIKAFISSNGTTFALASSNYNQTNELKIAIKYTANSCLLFINGVLEDTQVATGSPSGMNVLKFRRAVTLTPYYSGKLYNLSIFTEALTDAKCIALTTI